MRRIILWLVFMGMALGGCTSGETATLSAFDNISASATETQKGVVAYDADVKAWDKDYREELLAAIGKEVYADARMSLSETDANVLASATVQKLRVRLDALEAREAKRAELYRVTMDNLQYIMDVCKQGHDFILYSSSISAQWKQYLDTMSTARLSKVGVTK